MYKFTTFSFYICIHMKLRKMYVYIWSFCKFTTFSFYICFHKFYIFLQINSFFLFFFFPIPQPLHVPCFLVTIMSYDTHDSCNARVHCGFSFVDLFFIHFIFWINLEPYLLEKCYTYNIFTTNHR